MDKSKLGKNDFTGLSLYIDRKLDCDDVSGFISDCLFSYRLIPCFRGFEDAFVTGVITALFSLGWCCSFEEEEFLRRLGDEMLYFLEVENE